MLARFKNGTLFIVASPSRHAYDSIYESKRRRELNTSSAEEATLILFPQGSLGLPDYCSSLFPPMFLGFLTGRSRDSSPCSRPLVPPCSSVFPRVPDPYGVSLSPGLGRLPFPGPSISCYPMYICIFGPPTVFPTVPISKPHWYFGNSTAHPLPVSTSVPHFLLLPETTSS